MKAFPILLGLCLAVPSSALAWEDHSLMARPALAALPEVLAAPAVQVESLESFLEANGAGLVALLDGEEIWLRTHLEWYSPMPAQLAFQAAGDPETLRLRFMRALRINPNAKLALYNRLAVGDDGTGRPIIPWQDVTPMKDPSSLATAVLQGLQPGDTLSALDIVATAADEPDYGLDVGLFDNNSTEYGKSYGFGTQPFGNPALEFGSQAPFHMGFYHEAGIVYTLASFLGQSYPEYRIHLYQQLARQAFETGHPYWGWRFTGWALHYVMDLSQPYHTVALPGVSTCRMLWINALDMLGRSKSKEEALVLVSNRHLAFEQYVEQVLMESERGGKASPLLQSLSGDQDQNYIVWQETDPRHVISTESSVRAVTLDRAIATSIPARLVSDPSYNFDVDEPDIVVLEEIRKASVDLTDMDDVAQELLGFVGHHARVFVKSVEPGNGP